MTSAGMATAIASTNLAIANTSNNFALTITLPKGATGTATAGTTYKWNLSTVSTVNGASGFSTTNTWSGSTANISIGIPRCNGTSGTSEKAGTTWASLSAANTVMSTKLLHSYLSTCVAYNGGNPWPRGVTAFTASGSATITSAGTYLIVCVGAGGGANGCQAGGNAMINANRWHTGQPGTCGGTMMRYVYISAGAIVTATIGAGGAGATGNSSTKTSGGAGGNTSLKIGTTTYTASGGKNSIYIWNVYSYLYFG